MQSLLKAITVPRNRGEDDDDVDIGSQASSASSLTTSSTSSSSWERLDLSNGTLSLMEQESSTKKLMMMLATDNQEMKITIRSLAVSNAYILF